MGIANISMFSADAAMAQPDNVFELPEFTASCEDVQAAIVATFIARSDLCRRLGQQVTTLVRRNPRMPVRQLSHMALVEMITDMREEFPPQEFTVYTDLGDGNPAIDTIASTDQIRSRRLLAELMEPPAVVAERRAIREARTDASVVRAHGNIVEAVLFGTR